MPVHAQADMSDDSAVIAAAAQVTDAYFSYEKGGACIDVQGQGGIPGGGPGTVVSVLNVRVFCSLSLADSKMPIYDTAGPAAWGAWGYQSCTETLHQVRWRSAVRTIAVWMVKHLLSDLVAVEMHVTIVCAFPVLPESFHRTGTQMDCESLTST